MASWSRDHCPHIWLVDREDFLRVLADIETILVRASVAHNMDTAAIARVNMDIAVPQVSGQAIRRGDNR